MEARARVDDSRSSALVQARQQVERKQAVREEVDDMGQLEALVCDSTLASRETGVVHEDVERATRFSPLDTEFFDVGERRAVDLPQLDLAVIDTGRSDNLFACFFWVLLVRSRESTCHHHRRSSTSKVQRSLLADPRVRPRDEHRLTSTVVIGVFEVGKFERSVDITRVLAQLTVVLRPWLGHRQKPRTVAVRVVDRWYRCSACHFC